MNAIIRNLLILAAQGTFARNRFGIAFGAAFGIQLGLNNLEFALRMIPSAAFSALVAAFLVSLGIATWKTYKQVKATRPATTTTA